MSKDPVLTIVWLLSLTMAVGARADAVHLDRVRDFINRDHPISSERDHLVGVFRSVSDGSYLRAAFLSTILADSAR